MKHRKAGITVYLLVFNTLILCFSLLFILKTGPSSREFVAEKRTAQYLKMFAHSVANFLYRIDSIAQPEVATFNYDFLLPDALFKLIVQKDLDFRISFINGKGVIIGDSKATDITLLQNIGSYEDVKNALLGHEGFIVRKSSTTKSKIMHYAIPVSFKGRMYVLRLSMPLKTTLLFSENVQFNSIIAILIIISFASLCSLLASSFLISKIKLLYKAATEYSHSNFDYHTGITGPREIAKVAISLEQMAKQTKNNIIDISNRRNELQAIFSGITEGLIVFDTTLTVLKYNNAAKEFFQSIEHTNSTETISNISLIDFVHNTDIVDFVKDTITNIPDHKDETSVDILKLGKLTTLLVHCVPISVVTQKDCYILIFTDITKVKQLEQISSDFIVNVSHELKTPVTTIKGFAETLLDIPADNLVTQRHFLEIINTESDRLISILEYFLKLSRLEQEKTLHNTIHVDFSTFAHDLCISYSNTAKLKETTVQFQNLSTAKVTVNVDTVLMRHAIGNIFENAIKYCPKESVITCTIMQKDTNVVMIIEDNGFGIPTMYQSRIFERFFRIDKGRSREDGGTGLGLAITSKIIQMHNGSVIETSRPDGKSGARFEITLPII